MRLYRIAKSEHIGDLTGEGARVHGSRWNEKGIPVIYTSESLSLAALEFLAHMPMVLVPSGLKYRSFEIPDDVKFTSVRNPALPQDWDAMPFREETVRIGTKWARSGKTLMLRVPSVMVPEEFNFLINPLHPDFKKVKAGRASVFRFDERILKRGGRT
ncbi:MAG: RES family NAD+ phosphorylase [Thermoleophilia bacterium]